MMQTTWQLQDAKNKLSQLVNAAVESGPQIVTKHGKKTVVVISYEEFENLKADKPSFKDWLLSAPRVLDEPLDTSIPNDVIRPIEL